LGIHGSAPDPPFFVKIARSGTRRSVARHLLERPRNMRPTLLALLTLAAACSSNRSTSEDSVGALEQGRPLERGEFGAVGLALGETGMCTGTLVARQLVLTAQHCGRIVEFCPHGDPNEACYPADWTATPPERWDGPNACPSGADLEVVWLSQAPRDVRPIELPPAGTSVRTNDSCVAVGLGIHSVGHIGAPTVGQARAGSLAVSEIRADAIRGHGTSGYVAEGDSGGPVICGSSLVAVTSCGPENSPEGWFVRVDPWHDWIARAARGERPADVPRPPAPAAPGPAPAPPAEGNECTNGFARCDHLADHDQLYSCVHGTWKPMRACPPGNCIAINTSPSRVEAGCPN
jgi:hypothetical protein